MNVPTRASRFNAANVERAAWIVGVVGALLFAFAAYADRAVFEARAAGARVSACAAITPRHPCRACLPQRQRVAALSPSGRFGRA